MALPCGTTGSLSPTFVPARLVGLAVKLPRAFKQLLAPATSGPHCSSSALAEMDLITQFMELAANMVTIKTAGLGGLGAAVMASGSVPRAGPGRAVGLALMPLLRSLSVPSRRFDVITALQQRIKSSGMGTYIVVKGDKGVGKTCAIQTALHRTPAVVYVGVAPGTLEDAIIANVSAEIARMSARIINPLASAKRIIMFYRLMTFGGRPVIVLQLSERTHGKPYAELTGAVRRLTAMGLTVIVDASPNAVPPDLLSSDRQDIITVDHMPKELVVSEFPDLFQSMEAIKLRHVVLAVVGGVPAKAIRLSLKVRSASNPEQVEDVVNKFVKDELFTAITECKDAARHQPKMREIFDQLKSCDSVNYDSLEKCGVELRSPEKILRVVDKMGEPFLVPATPAMKIVLYHGLTKVPPLDELRSMTIE